MNKKILNDIIKQLEGIKEEIESLVSEETDKLDDVSEDSERYKTISENASALDEIADDTGKLISSITEVMEHNKLFKQLDNGELICDGDPLEALSKRQFIKQIADVVLNGEEATYSLEIVESICNNFRRLSFECGMVRSFMHYTMAFEYKKKG